MSDTKLPRGIARELSNTPVNGSATIEEIAAASGVSYSTCRVNLRKLEKRGLIRHRDGYHGSHRYQQVPQVDEATAAVDTAEPALAGAQS